MYCIECGAPIEATARICGACRFPQPLEEFADVEPALAAAAPSLAPKPVFPVRLEDTPQKASHKPRVATALAVFIALCISTGLSVYLLTRVPVVPKSPASTSTETSTGTEASAKPDTTSDQSATKPDTPNAQNN
ncbi:MAG: hypothetical protein FJY25_06330 [Betaproteobacteria bacterium]|nr:hypothetical protein [Betaproteobacteria bacterium]